MFLLAKLYVAGIQSRVRDHEHRLQRRPRKQISVCTSQPPLRVALRGRANDAATAREGESQDTDQNCDDHWSV